MKRMVFLGLVVALLLVVAVAAYVYYGFTHRVEGAYFDSAGVRIHYTDEGAGEPVILVHGFAVNGDLNWRRPGILDALAKDFRVVTMDLRGHGLSGKPHDKEQYGLEMVKDVIRLMDHLSIEKAHVVGYSLGGFITLKLATLYPDRLLTASPLGAGWERLEVGRFLPLMEELGERLDAGHGVRPPSGMLGADRHKPTRIHTLAVRILTGFFNDGKALAATLRSAPDFAIPEEAIRAIPVPVCSIVGSLDPLKVGVDNMNGLVPDHTVVVLDGADHMRAPSRRDFLEALRDFLLKHRQPET